MNINNDHHEKLVGTNTGDWISGMSHTKQLGENVEYDVHIQVFGGWRENVR